MFSFKTSSKKSPKNNEKDQDPSPDLEAMTGNLKFRLKEIKEIYNDLDNEVEDLKYQEECIIAGITKCTELGIYKKAEECILKRQQYDEEEQELLKQEAQLLRELDILNLNEQLGKKPNSSKTPKNDPNSPETSTPQPTSRKTSRKTSFKGLLRAQHHHESPPPSPKSTPQPPVKVVDKGLWPQGSPARIPTRIARLMKGEAPVQQVSPKNNTDPTGTTSSTSDYGTIVPPIINSPKSGNNIAIDQTETDDPLSKPRNQDSEDTCQMAGCNSPKDCVVQ